MRPTKAELEASAHRAQQADAQQRDCDKLLRYLAKEINPARVAEGLEPISDAAAAHIHAVMYWARYQ